MATTSATDKWFNRLGTQAARINELLSAGTFLSANDGYDILVREFPTTTVSRVRSHFRWLDQHHPGRLREQRAGRLITYRLV
jgi:hypothetical protein